MRPLECLSELFVDVRKERTRTEADADLVLKQDLLQVHMRGSCSALAKDDSRTVNVTIEAPPWLSPKPALLYSEEYSIQLATYRQTAMR